jgi:outer membrane biosynthesis protein TonB
VQKFARKTKSGGHSNPFDTDSDDSADAQKGKAADDSAAKAGKAGAAREPAPTSGRKSGASLDNLMTDVVSDKQPNKGKKDTKEMDALLKDVQKAGPAPVAKKEAPASAPPLSPSDISTAMAQVKVKGNACAQKFGRGGTAELKITVGMDGKVTDVQLGGKLVGTPVAGCIEQAARSASFRPNAGLRFDYRMDVR